MYIIEGKRIIAWRSLPSLSTTSVQESPSVSSDGNTLLISANEKGISACYRIVIDGKRITYTQSFVTCESPLPFIAYIGFDSPSFIGNDRILFRNGALYDLKGKIGAADGWTLFGEQPGPAVIQGHQLPGEQEWKYRSLNVKTGDHWIIPHAALGDGILTTPDGRYVAYVQTAQTENMIHLREWMAGKPVLKYLQNMVPTGSSTATLCLYEKPGRLRARLPFAANHNGNFYTDPRTKAIYELETARFSPDGHSIFITVRQGEGDRQKRELWRFKW